MKRQMATFQSLVKGEQGSVGVEERSFNLAGWVLRAECQKSSVSEMRVENIRAAECGLLPTSSLLASTELSSSPASQQSKYQDGSEWKSKKYND